jgi:small subunit ribosomal protein S5
MRQKRGPAPRQESERDELQERVIYINRVAKVVKGGRRFSFSAIVAVGDGQNRVGVAMGKANEVADAIRKGEDIARKSLFQVKMVNQTIPHEVIGKFSASVVMLKPAVAGTGVIAGGAARAILKLAGIRNVISKSLGSNNKWNVVHATVAALNQLRTTAEAQAARGLTQNP